MAFLKAMRRRLNSASIVTVAAVLDAPRIALGGVRRTPVRARQAEAATAAGVEAAAQAALHDIDPFDDAYASAWYRRRVVPSTSAARCSERSLMRSSVIELTVNEWSASSSSRPAPRS
jgi:CO/xanthine dehydrogenase FAD-binding subunit